MKNKEQVDLEFLNIKGADVPGFKVPNNYFTSLEDEIMTNVFERNLPKEPAYKIPENYFENFEKELFKNNVLKTSKRVRYLYIASSIAASILLFFTINNYFSNHEELTFDSLTTAEIDAYIENEEFYVDSYEIAESLPTDINISFFNKSTANNKEVIDDLEEIDTELLLLQNDSL